MPTGNDNENGTNWDKLQERQIDDTIEYRDVYEDQQLERTRMNQERTMKSRNIANMILTVFVFIVTYFVAGLIRAGLAFAVEGSAANLGAEVVHVTVLRIFICIITSAIFYGIMYLVLKHNFDVQTADNQSADINQYPNDQHIALPEEIQRKFDWFPDVGATSDIQFSSMISHCAINNKGLDMVQVARRAVNDVCDDEGDVILFKGEMLKDENGDVLFENKPMIDIDFMNSLYNASGVPEDREIRKFYDTRQIPYNPDGKDRDKLGKYDTVADLINADWEFPEYEPQRPGGAYLVDTAPVNTMVLAITRAGKGQTVIEPTLDMWTRERKPSNIVINDPKGELLVKFYVRGTVRGYQVVQFNLINAMKTDIYNPLGLASEAAREGDFTKCALYVENIADVFFPMDGGDDPVWPNAANNAFKRAAYGLIDYFLEEEKELRLFAEQTGMDEKVMDTKLDIMWGQVTLYNAYQLFVQLTSKKLPNPATQFTKDAKAGKYDEVSDEEYEKMLDDVKKDAMLWENKPEADMMTIYFNATDTLPVNSMRRLISNANNALRSMAGAEKMLSSVYGIAITAMSFFTDPTISTLTSGTPSQNADLPGLSFPRVLGVRFHPDFLEKYHLIGMQAVWRSFEDKNFTKPMGKDFEHEDTVSREGWAKYYFKGKYPKSYAYVRLQIKNPQTGMLIRTFYFQFKKSYQTSLDARYYIQDPVLGEKIIKNGVLTELRKVKKKDGSVVFRKAKTMFTEDKIPVDEIVAAMNDDFLNEGDGKQQVELAAITQKQIRYSEKPKMVFLVTPPHLMKYAKLILILISQLVNLNFDKSYMTKSNQKPLYKTRFMLDELGNLQSEGHGISSFATMLSIGLGQDQQFTLILQTLQQLRDVYGDSVDKIVQGNTSNIVFLKSTDDSMLDTLQKMSGTTHRTYKDSKTVTADKEKLVMQNEGKVTYTITTKEVPVISYNDMAFISERNSIVFRAGDSPIWNRNEMVLPMSWKLFDNTIEHAGHDYSLQTIPTLSSALDFDVRKNQPDFQKMLTKRRNQAIVAGEATEQYQVAYGYSDYEMEQLDPDTKADDIMQVINTYIRMEAEQENAADAEEFEMLSDVSWLEHAEENKDVTDAIAEAEAQQKVLDEKRYAGGLLSKEDVVSRTNGSNRSLDKEIVSAFIASSMEMLSDTRFFSNHGGDLYSADGSTPYIIRERQSEELQQLQNAGTDPNSRVFSEGQITEKDLSNMASWKVTDAFYTFLVSQDSWNFADGKFEHEMYNRMQTAEGSGEAA